MKIFSEKDLVGLDNYSSKEIATFLHCFFDQRMELFKEKDESYGGSWQKDGKVGAFLNLKRKMDRAIKRFKTGKLFDSSSDSTDETNIDTLQDLSNYSDMLAALMFLQCDDELQFLAYVNKVPYLKEKFCFVEGKVQIIK